MNDLLAQMETLVQLLLDAVRNFKVLWCLFVCIFVFHIFAKGLEMLTNMWSLCHFTCNIGVFFMTDDFSPCSHLLCEEGLTPLNVFEYSMNKMFSKNSHT